MMRKRAALVAVLAMTFALAFAGAQTAYAKGVDCEIADCAKDAFTWDSSTNTLTMNEAEIDCPDAYHYYDLVHFAPDESSVGSTGVDGGTNPTATVNIAGPTRVFPNGVLENVIAADDVDLVITGPQSLTVEGRCSGNAIEAFRSGITVEAGFLNFDGEYCSIRVYNDFTIAGDDASISLKNIGDSCGITVGGDFTMNGGRLYVEGCNAGVFCNGNDSVLTIAGGDATVRDAFIGLQSTGDVNLTGGLVVVSAVEQSGIELAGTVNVDGAELVIDGTGALYGVYSNRGGFTASSGTAIIDNSETGIRLADGTLFNPANTCVIDGGSVYFHDIVSTAIETTNLDVKAGKLEIIGCVMPFEAYDSFTMTGGELVVKSHGVGLDANKKLHIVGGAATIQCGSADDDVLMTGSDCDLKVDPACLTVKTGHLPEGVAFMASGSIYEVDEFEDGVILKSYGDSSTTPTVNTVKYGGCTYAVRAIGAGAFSTVQGKAVTKLTLGTKVEIIGAKAFAGTSNLVTLDAKKFRYRGAELDKVAFKKCGKSNGKKLTVLCKKADINPMKTLLVSKGLSNKAAFKAK